MKEKVVLKAFLTDFFKDTNLEKMCDFLVAPIASIKAIPHIT